MATEVFSSGSSSLLTIEEMARELRISTNTIYYWVRCGEIPFLKMGRHLRFQREAVLEFFKTKSERKASSCRAPAPLIEDDPIYGKFPFRRSLKTRV